MNSNFEKDSGLELFLEQKDKYRARVRNLSLVERLRQLEELQQQNYEILSIREANGGKPIPDGWKRWAKAQESLKR